jgi:Superinfection immunity protein
MWDADRDGTSSLLERERLTLGDHVEWNYGNSTIALAVIAIVAVLIDFLPWLPGASRGVNSSLVLFLFNLLLGWTVQGACLSYAPDGAWLSPARHG